MDPSAVALVDELLRLLRAGGKRVRPALCFWAFRAAGGGEDEPIVPVCAALELLHTSALVHDDLMDRDAERRGVDATHVRFAKDAPAGVDPEAFGTSAAVLVGDLALVLSERLLRTSGFEAGRLDAAMARFDRMRAEMAAGQFLDVSGARDLARVRALKTGSYTAEGPVLIGAALAGAGPEAEGPLRVFGRLVGEAFQLRDDVVGRRSRDRGRRRRGGSGRARHPGARRRAAPSRWHRRAGPDRGAPPSPGARLMRVSNAEVGAARRMFASLPSAAVATTNADGSPHVVPLWFVWPEEAIFVSTRQDGRTWANAARDPRVAITIDLGRAWVEVAGVEIVGRAEPLAAESAAMRKPISAWHEKYRPLLAGEGFARFAEEVRGLGFLRVVPDAVRAWDHARGR